MGGQIGMWLGLHHSDRVRRLVLCSTSARIGTPELWSSRIEAVRHGGVQAIAGDVVARWFSLEFRSEQPEIVHSFEHLLAATSARGYVACCEAIRDADLRTSISTIRIPTAIVSGTHDPATTPRHPALTVNTFEIAHHQQPKVDARCKSRPTERLRIEPLTQAF